MYWDAHDSGQCLSILAATMPLKPIYPITASLWAAPLLLLAPFFPCSRATHETGQCLWIWNLLPMLPCIICALYLQLPQPHHCLTLGNINASAFLLPLRPHPHHCMSVESACVLLLLPSRSFFCLPATQGSATGLLMPSCLLPPTPNGS